MQEGNPFDRLSPRMRQAANAIARGLNRREIADEMGVAVKTVDSFKSRSFMILGVRNDVEIARLAIKHGEAPLCL